MEFYGLVEEWGTEILTPDQKGNKNSNNKMNKWALNVEHA